MKTTVTISMILAMTVLLSFYDRQQQTSDLLNGKWFFIRSYKGVDVDIKDKEAETKMWTHLDVHKFYNKGDSSFRYVEDDMIEEGWYIFDTQNRIIKEVRKYQKKTDTVFLKVTYLDSGHLMYVDQYNYTRLFKKQ